MNARIGIVALAAILSMSQAAQARQSDEDAYAGYFQTWLAAGDTLGRQDVRFGEVNHNGAGVGLGVRAGFEIPVVRDFSLGAWAGGEAMGGNQSGSYDDTGVYFTWRVELGLQSGFRAAGLRWQVRLGKQWMADSAVAYSSIDAASFSMWLARVRADFAVWSFEVGGGVGDFSSELLAVRYRKSPLVCPGVMLEHYSRSGVDQTMGTHLRVFWSIDF
jgi:hypothetical protein